jgi:hypothetical protein
VLDRLEEHEAHNKARRKSDPNRDFPTPFVHLGSYHCLMTLYNVGVSYPWGPSTDRQDCKITREAFDKKVDEVDVKISYDRIAAPIFQRKRYPARSIPEHTRVPATRDFDIYTMPFGKVAMLICSDVVDLNQSLSVVRYNRTSRSQPPIDFVLVPSYNRSPVLVSMCRELSFFANATVVLVNANPKDVGAPPTDIFCCGHSFDELLAAYAQSPIPPVISKSSRPVKYADGRESEMILFTLSRSGLNSMRHQTSGERAKDGDDGDAKKPGNA